jgi:hypothetical protein
MDPSLIHFRTSIFGSLTSWAPIPRPPAVYHTPTSRAGYTGTPPWGVTNSWLQNQLLLHTLRLPHSFTSLTQAGFTGHQQPDPPPDSCQTMGLILTNNTAASYSTLPINGVYGRSQKLGGVPKSHAPARDGTYLAFGWRLGKCRVNYLHC